MKRKGESHIYHLKKNKKLNQPSVQHLMYVLSHLYIHAVWVNDMWNKLNGQYWKTYNEMDF